VGVPVVPTWRSQFSPLSGRLLRASGFLTARQNEGKQNQSHLDRPSRRSPGPLLLLQATRNRWTAPSGMILRPERPSSPSRTPPAGPVARTGKTVILTARLSSTRVKAPRTRTFSGVYVDPARRPPCGPSRRPPLVGPPPFSRPGGRRKGANVDIALRPTNGGTGGRSPRPGAPGGPPPPRPPPPPPPPITTLPFGLCGVAGEVIVCSSPPTLADSLFFFLDAFLSPISFSRRGRSPQCPSRDPPNEINRGSPRVGV